MMCERYTNPILNAPSMCLTVKSCAYADLAEEVVAGAVARRYVHGAQRISQTQLISSAWTTHYYGYDGGFSVRQLNDGAGAVTDTYAYDAFGDMIESTGSTPNVFSYRAELSDSALGLYYLRARWYEPRTGRFMTADKWEPGASTTCCSALANAGRTIAHHLYSYTGGDPVNYLDPSGLDRGLLLAVLDWWKTAAFWKKIAVAGLATASVFCKIVAYLDLHYRIGDSWAPRNPPPNWAQIVCNINELVGP